MNEQALDGRCPLGEARLVKAAINPTAEERKSALPRDAATHCGEGVARAGNLREGEERVLVLPAAVEQDDGREVRAACHVHESRSVESSTTPSCPSGRVARSRVGTIATPNTCDEPEVAA